MQNSLITHEITKHHRKRKILADVSITLDQGSIVGLLGPNGAGKTTCFYMILGLITCDSGKIWLNQQDITYLPLHKRSSLGIGYLPQEPSIFRKLSVADNILSVLEVTNNDSSVRREQQLKQYLAEFDLLPRSKDLAIKLSGGERRRLEIARTLATNPKFLLLDEPFAGVDPIAIAEIKLILQRLRQKKIGVLITDHNVRATLDICDKSYILNHGKIIAAGGKATIINHPEVKQVYLGKEFTV